MTTATRTIEELANREYQYGFVTDIEAETVPRASARTSSASSRQRKASRVAAGVAPQGVPHWLTMTEPTWPNVHYPPSTTRTSSITPRPSKKPTLEQPGRGRSRNCCSTFEKLGIPLRGAEAARRRRGRRRVRQRLRRDDVQGQAGGAGHHLLLLLRGGAGASRAGAEVPRLGRAVHRQLLRDAQLGGLQRRLVLLHPQGRALPDGAVHLLPHQRQGHRPVRAHADHRRRRRATSATSKAARRRCATRTSCTPPWSSSSRSTTRQIKYSTVQNWYPGDKEGKGGIYNFVTKRGKCAGVNSKISWTQVETGSAITWKYPSCILQGDNSVGEFYSVALTNN